MANEALKAEQGSLSTPTDWKVITAIDFGTKYSGYAFRIRGKNGITTPTNWGGGGYCKHKTPTSVLFNEDGSIKHFGQKAVVEFTNMDSDDEEEAMYFTNFKMKLYKKVGSEKLMLDDNLELISSSGGKMKALDVFAKSLQCLKEKFYSSVERLAGFVPGKDDVLWVVTVPAIWEDAAKQFMRTASLQAGLIDSLDSDRLLIALEPEAAALWCKTEAIAQYSDTSECVSLPKAGDSLLVVDAGGGTVDIAALQLINDNEVRQLHRAAGGAHGGQAVNDNFQNLMEEVFGTEKMDEFHAGKSQSSEKLMQNIETAKTSYAGIEDSAMRIALPPEFFELLSKDEVKQKIKEYNKDSAEKLKLSSSSLTLVPNKANKLFQPVIDAIIKCTREVYDHPEVKDVKVFFLVGGFAESNLLYTSLAAAFPDVCVLVPDDPGAAVMKGAVLFGENPLIITERIAPRSYGTEIAEIYDPDKHGDEDSLKDNIKVMNGDKYVVGLYESFVKKGDILQNDDTREGHFSPLDHNATSMTAKIYSSTETDVKFVNDEFCEKLGEAQIPLEHTGNFRPCKVKLQFGGTHLKVHLLDKTTGSSKEIPISFISE